MMSWFSFDCTGCSHTAAHELLEVGNLPEPAKELPFFIEPVEDPLVDNLSTLEALSNVEIPLDKRSIISSDDATTCTGNATDLDVVDSFKVESDSGDDVVEDMTVPGASQVVPLTEDLPIFELDEKRFGAAQQCLDTFRTRVEDELLSKIPETKGSKCQHSLARRFCTDATLLRYLCTSTCVQDKALEMLKATVHWRASYLSMGATHCPRCLKDPRSHCFIHMGQDAMQRPVIYSCAGRAANKTVADGIRHMACELERIFEGNSAPGSVVWVVDFAGFGLSDCNPKVGTTAIPMFANHYPERFAQIVLLSMPSFFQFFYNSAAALVDPVMQRKVLFLNTLEDRKRYSDAYWQSNPSMAAWLEAVNHCDGKPGCYPDVSLAASLKDDTTRDFLERSASQSCQ